LFRKGDINNPIFNEVAVENLSSKDVYIETSDKDIAYGYANFLKNIDEKNDLVLRVSVPREIYKNGLVVSWSIVISLLIVAVFASLIFIYIINSLIIKRIYLLINKISEVESGKSGVSDILLSGKDEISFLSGKLKSAIEKSVDVGEKATLRSRELEQSQKAILNVLEDIETEKNKIESLAGDLEKFKLAVDNASDHIVITDPDGVILYANRAVEKITGYSHSEVIGNKPSLWGKQMPEEFYNNLWKTIKEEKTNFIGELNNRRKNGEIYVAEASISPILNSNNKVIFFVGIERDITLLKEISDAKTEFVSVASHQLRTPLTGIK
jgi:PAS domain S-box-containing protein